MTDEIFKLRPGLENFPDFSPDVPQRLSERMHQIVNSHWEKNNHLFKATTKRTNPPRYNTNRFKEFRDSAKDAKSLYFTGMESTLKTIHEYFKAESYKNRMMAYIEHLQMFKDAFSHKFEQIELEMDAQIGREKGDDSVKDKTVKWGLNDYLFTVYDLESFIYAIADVPRDTNEETAIDWWNNAYVCPEFAQIVYRLLQLAHFDGEPKFNEIIKKTWNVPLVTYFFQLFYPVFNDTPVHPLPAIRLPQFLYCGVDWPLEIPRDLDEHVDNLDPMRTFAQERVFMQYIKDNKDEIEKEGLSFFIGKKKKKTGARSTMKDDEGRQDNDKIKQLLVEQINVINDGCLEEWKTTFEAIKDELPHTME